MSLMLAPWDGVPVDEISKTGRKMAVPFNVINKHQLEEIIPHRGNAVKIDGFSRDEKFGFRYLSHTDPIFIGHFPGNPVCPNDELDEIFNITAAVFFKSTMPEITGFPMIVKKDGVAYKNPAKPGDLLKINVYLQKNLRNKFFVFSGIITNQRNETVAIYGSITGAAVPM